MGRTELYAKRGGCLGGWEEGGLVAIKCSTCRRQLSDLLRTFLVTPVVSSCGVSPFLEKHNFAPGGGGA